MSISDNSLEIPGYCALCRSRCGCVSVVRDGRLVKVRPDPSHPTGKALCSKGRAAPSLVEDKQRLLYPLRRTRPKGEADPGWKRISWDEALDLTGSRMAELAASCGPESVAFSITSPSSSAMSDSLPWVSRLMNLYGSPNACTASELCNWHKDFSSRDTFGCGIPMPDFERTNCLLLWGFNPSVSWLAQAVEIVEARKRGSTLIVVDPRRTGLAARADLWLRVLPGSDAALALGIANLMIKSGNFDVGFVRQWTNATFLVRRDSGLFLRGREIDRAGDPESFVQWDENLSSPVLFSSLHSPSVPGPVALDGSQQIETLQGPVECSTAFALFRKTCESYSPDRVKQLTGVEPESLIRAAHLLYSARPVSYYAWSGLEQHANATQTNRALSLLYTLTGCFDADGGNILLSRVPTNDVSAFDRLPAQQRSKTLGLQERPFGPATQGWVTGADLNRAILEEKPYPVRGLVAFGTNLLASRSDVNRTSRALSRLDFYVHADLFINPSMALADVILPVCSAWERDALRVGFEISQRAESRVQYRLPVLFPRGESKSDTWVVFRLACKLGLADEFWGGDIEAGYRYILEPSGIDLTDLKRCPQGIDLPLKTHRRRFTASGFETPTRKIEIYSEVFLTRGESPLPGYRNPVVDELSLAETYPFILTCAKLPYFCNSQHRSLPGQRRQVPEPRVELNSATARDRGIADGDWVAITTPEGRMRARAVLRDTLAAQVVCAEFGWWQACDELDLPSYPVDGIGNSNFNGLIGSQVIDPVSGAVPVRSSRCQVAPVKG